MPTVTDVNPAKVNELIDQVYNAFTKHCEDIHNETIGKLKQTTDQDVEARKAILKDQKSKLDQTLAELKNVLNDITRKARKKLEDLEKAETEKSFDMDAQLANL
jgi:ABC-type transporter Mla subunit MlaD